MYVPEMESHDDFWDTISVFQSAVLSANDLFVSTPPVSINNQSKIQINHHELIIGIDLGNGSSSSFLDSSVSPGLYYLLFLNLTIFFYTDKKDSSPSYRSISNNNTKRKSTELTSYPGIYKINIHFLF